MSSGEQSGTGRAVGGDAEMSTLMTMLFAIASIEKSIMTSSRHDPAADIHKLCTTLDQILGATGGWSKNAEGLDGRRTGRTGSGLASVLSGKWM